MNKKLIIKLSMVFAVLTIFYGWVAIEDKHNKHTHNDVEHFHKKSHENEDINYFDSYEIISREFGTQTKVTVDQSSRKMVTNALPDHKTGSYPQKGNPNSISAQNRTYTFPVNPKYLGKPTWVREPGVALNGIKFEPGTAEVIVCETGENYRVEAFQDLINLGLDFNHAHVQPSGAYHYHGSPTSVIEKLDNGKDLVHIGFAHDGFPIYYSKSSAYKSSYRLQNGNRLGEDCTYTNPKETIKVNVNDNHDGTFGSDYEYVSGLGDLDECNGTTINGKYVYLVTDEFPYVSRCLMGEYEEKRGERGRDNRDRPRSFNDLLSFMDENKDGKLSKKEVKGPLERDFSRIDRNKDGFITKDELKNHRPRRQ